MSGPLYLKRGVYRSPSVRMRRWALRHSIGIAVLAVLLAWGLLIAFMP